MPRRSVTKGGFIVTADWHCHCWRDGGEPVGGINGRLKDFLTAFDQLVAYAREHDVKRIYVLGDIFHLKKNIPVQAFDQLWLHLWQARTLEWIFLAGNHDREDDRHDSVTILPFKDVGRVIVEPEHDDHAVVYVPWLYEQDRIQKFMKQLGKREYEMLVFHGEMDGAIVGPTDYHIKSVVTEQSFGLKRFGHIYAGHLHKRQEINGVWYPGSLLAKDFGEIEMDKGFLHVTDAGVAPVVLDSPKFMTYFLRPKPPEQIIRQICSAIAGNFVRILSAEPVDPALVKELEQAEPRTLQFKLDRATRTATDFGVPVKEKSWGELVRSYVEQKGVPEDLVQVYVDYGQKILEST
jgi:DNA repair exonuclease SbcCD nuclease subunit